MGIYLGMARAATTTDVFNAIAEPRRREIIGALAQGRARAVGDLVRALRMPQPAVSKHLRVLRSVGLVSVRRHGRHKIYALNAQELRPVYEWVKIFERYWSRQLDRIKERAERKAREQSGPNNQPKEG